MQHDFNFLFCLIYLISSDTFQAITYLIGVQQISGEHIVIHQCVEYNDLPAIQLD